MICHTICLFDVDKIARFRFLVLEFSFILFIIFTISGISDYFVFIFQRVYPEKISGGPLIPPPINLLDRMENFETLLVSLDLIEKKMIENNGALLF